LRILARHFRYARDVMCNDNRNQITLNIYRIKKHMNYHLLFFFLILGKFGLAKNNDQSVVQFNETYELANIILALTDYGKMDKSEVNKQTLYYQQVQEYFYSVSKHPLLEKVNYSREKWDKLLSFRTDAVAFCFDNNGKLYRKYKFYSMGKEINEFEDNLDLIQDFVIKSNFRAFFDQKKSYFDSIANLYQESLMINEIEVFLNKEFGIKTKSKHRIIVSPLVGRMHCQRLFNKASTSFINIPDYLFNFSSVKDVNEKDIASGIHMFFTEVDHDYVNPTTNKFKKEYQQYFDQKKWDKESGYGEWEMAVFNEYMTWAVYDLFITKNFPNVASSEIKEWHDVNISRGFFASKLFGEKLLELYLKKGEEETIRDLYIKILLWCKEVENDLDNLTKNNAHNTQ